MPIFTMVSNEWKDFLITNYLRKLKTFLFLNPIYLADAKVNLKSYMFY